MALPTSVFKYFTGKLLALPTSSRWAKTVHFWPFFGGVGQHITCIFWTPASVFTRRRDVRCPSACISLRHGKVWCISDFACRSFVRSFRLCLSSSCYRAAIPFDTGQSDSLVVVEVSFLRLSHSILLSLFYYTRRSATW